MTRSRRQGKVKNDVKTRLLAGRTSLFPWFTGGGKQEDKDPRD